MAKIARPRVATKERLDVSSFPEEVSVALHEVAASAREGLLALSVATGLAVMSAIFESDVKRIVGPKGKHDPERTAHRHGTEDAHVVLGGRQVPVDKPRVRSLEGHEIKLASYRHFADTDMLSDIALGRMLAGLSTRRYDAGAEPIGDIPTRGTSRSAVSRRFVAGTSAKLAEVFGRDLSELANGASIHEVAVLLGMRSLDRAATFIGFDWAGGAVSEKPTASSLEKVEAILNNPAIYELARAVSGPAKSGRRRDYPTFMPALAPLASRDSLVDVRPQPIVVEIPVHQDPQDPGTWGEVLK